MRRYVGNMPRNYEDFGPTAKKIILLLSAGITLGLSPDPRVHFKVLRAVYKEWQAIEHDTLSRTVKRLYKSKLVRAKRNKDGTCTLVLTRDGKKKALTYKIDNIKIKPTEKWDGKWRFVIFDVPENFRKIRNSLRNTLKRLEFFEYQKSVFVHPFECRDEIDFVVEYFDVRPYARFVIAESMDNELHLKKHFKLS